MLKLEKLDEKPCFFCTLQTLTFTCLLFLRVHQIALNVMVFAQHTTTQ